MSWMQVLYETYEACHGHEPDGSAKLMPVAHTTQQAHIEVVLDSRGSFRRARVLSKDESTTLIPCTEASGGRSGRKPVAHPLCDKLQYLAADYLEFGGQVTSGFSKDEEEPHRTYLALLSSWSASIHRHSKLEAILHYVRKGSLLADLVGQKLLPVDEWKCLLKAWTGKKEEMPDIYKILPAGQTPEDAFIRWSVEGEDVAAGTWEDQKLIAAWIAFYKQTQALKGFCMVEGTQTTLAVQHPAKLRNAGDKAKLISANDKSGFTYLGRFTKPEQAAGVGFMTTQKAHNALRWLIERQGSRNGDQAIVSWTVAGRSIPNPMQSSYEIFDDVEATMDTSAGQHFALALRAAISGYRKALNPSDDVHILGLDSATPGRLSIIYYRRLRNSEFLERLQEWHERFAWAQHFGMDRQFIGAPSPRDIALAAYGRRLDAKLEAATRERLLPCIVDQTQLPLDLVDATRLRVVNRVGTDRWEWEKNLGIACALYKGANYTRNYQMALETDRASRDYLYGRLLAIAENIESKALSSAEASRETNAARFMHRFSQKPYSTWLMLYAQMLVPYRTRLRSQQPAFLVHREKLVDDICNAFDHDDFVSDTALTGEFLLGYHCQRADLYRKKETTPPLDASVN